MYNTTGDIQKKPYPTENAFQVITEPVQFFIIHLLLDRPGIYLWEIKSTLEVELGVDITESAICHPAKAQKLLVKGERISVIAAMSVHGILAVDIV